MVVEEVYNGDTKTKTIFTKGRNELGENWLVITQEDKWTEKYQVELGKKELQKLKKFILKEANENAGREF